MSVHPSAYIFVVVALLGGLMAVTLRNILHAIFGLALTLFAIAALFVYLGSPFVAAMQVLIYVGGISVAMVFAVMFAYSLGAREAGAGRRLLGLIPAAVFIAGVAVALREARFQPPAAHEQSSLAQIGRDLLTHYNLVFEALSVILLLAIVGAIVIARKEPEA